MDFCTFAKCVGFLVASLFAFALIGIASWNISHFLSSFEFADEVKTSNRKIPGVGLTIHNKSDPNIVYACSFESTSRGSRFWCTLLMVCWDLFLLLSFCAQHRFMARTSFKMYLEHILEEAYILERPLYLLTTSAVLNWLIRSWQPLDTYLWYLEPARWPILNLILYIVHVCAWLIIIGEMFLMDMFELFGLKQVYYYCMDMAHPLQYKTVPCQRLYRRMRHPGLVCLLVIVWLYPIMSLDRYLIASVFTLYLLYGHHVRGEDYEYVVEMYDKKVVELNASYHTD